MLANGPDPEKDHKGDVSKSPFEDMKDIRSAASFLHAGGGAMPVDSNGLPWNGTFVFSTGNLVLDLLHNFFLECGARMHKLRVYETLSDPTGREVCGYLLVRGSVHAHSYALALKKLTGVEMEKLLPTPNIDLSKIPESQKYLDEGSHRRLYTWGEETYRDMEAIWGNGEQALPTDPPGELEVVSGHPQGAKIDELKGASSAFTTDYDPMEIFEIAAKLHAKM
jgi:Mn-containing catalase